MTPAKPKNGNGWPRLILGLIGTGAVVAGLVWSLASQRVDSAVTPVAARVELHEKRLDRQDELAGEIRERLAHIETMLEAIADD